KTDNVYVVTVRGGVDGIKDSAGNPLSADAIWTFHTVAPVVAIVGAPANSLEGTALPLTSSVTDPSPPFIYAWAVTKNGAAYTSGSESSLNFRPDDNASYVVTLNVTDNDGGTGNATQTITVTNVPPTVSITGAPANSPEGTAIPLGSAVT